MKLQKFMGGTEPKYETADGPYPGLLHPRVMGSEFGTGPVRIRYEIWVDGKLDRQGACGVDLREAALSMIRSRLHRGRYAPMGRRLAEIRVYDADSGELIKSDRQVVVREKGEAPIVLWASGQARLARGTRAMVRAMGPPG
jgi:hypothetical protein